MKAFSVETIVDVTGFAARARGLIGRPPPRPDTAWRFGRCASVHGFGMSHPVDVVFLDRHDRVVRVATLRPWRALVCREAATVLELRAGEAGRLGLHPGRLLSLPPGASHRSASPARAAGLRPLPSDPEHDPMNVEPMPNDDRTASPPPSGAVRAGWWLFAVLCVVCCCDVGNASPGRTASRAASAAAQDADPALGERADLDRLQGWRLRGVPDAATSVADDVPQAAARPDAAGQSPAAPSLPRRTLDRMADEAEALYRSGDDAAALERFQRVASYDPQRHVRAWLRIGNLHQKRARIGAAIDAYITAVDGADGAVHPDTWPVAEREARRKALMNLNALSLQQAARSSGELTRLGRQDAASGGVTAAGRPPRDAFPRAGSSRQRPVDRLAIQAEGGAPSAVQDAFR